jgi:2-(1,2-epoxy-1,2-dihydrophenyl)acetyl-CoA isomerase
MSEHNEVLRTENHGAAHWIVLNRPEKLNALNSALRHELAVCLRKLGRDGDLRCLVITGAGDSFCAGADVSEFPRDPDTIPAVVEEYTTIINQLRTLDVPTVACVNGTAVGFGASIALACDLRYSHPRTALAFSAIKLGLLGDGGVGTQLLRTVGRPRTFEYLYTGRPISGEEAMRVGLVNQLFSAERLRTEVDRIACALASGPRNAIAATKRIVNHAEAADFDDSMEFEFLLQGVQMAGPEVKRGLDAFRAKTIPTFD